MGAGMTRTPLASEQSDRAMPTPSSPWTKSVHGPSTSDAVGAALMTVALLLFWPTGAKAQSSSHGASDVSGVEQQNEQHRGENGQKNTHPVEITLNYASDLNADVAGGQSRGVEYLGRIGVLLDADLDRLVGVTGAKAHLSFYQVHGSGLSGSRIGNLLTVSGIEASPAIRLNQVWVEFARASKATLRIGKFTAAQDFMNSSTASLFVNSTFGWPGSFGTDLPSGGPAYPLGAPGVRLAVKPDDATTLQVAAFTGDPAGPGRGDPQRRERHGFNTFGFAGAPFVIAEVGRDTGGKTPTFTWRLGGWVHFDRFADVSRTPATPAVTPGEMVGPDGYRGNVGAYGFVDAQAWKSATNGKRVARVFARASYSPPDRNVVDLYVDAGASLAAPLRGRDGDTVGIAIGIARISPEVREAARALIGAGRAATIPPGYEGVVEVSYRATVVGKLKLEPNLQLVLNPAGSALAVRTLGGRVPSALVLGLRTSVSF